MLLFKVSDLICINNDKMITYSLKVSYFEIFVKENFSLIDIFCSIFIHIETLHYQWRASNIVL